MSREADNWLKDGAEGFLRRIGLGQGDRVLDFGARNGAYAFPAARVVGKTGRVYAADKDKGALQKTKRRARSAGIENLHAVHVPDGGPVPVPKGSVDVVLLYDILHGGYFPEAAQRVRLLRRLRRTLKPGGLLSCHLTHVRQFGLTYRQLLGEIREVGFVLEGESRRTLIHDDRLVRDRVFRFRKPRRERRGGNRHRRRSE
ncbi:MAG TPA: methyltransferase domain-containing protein [Phycisphaerae bacterium]|nr:methyltransferase domain-containing protein [Phycisphaerae bacterium]